MPVKSIWILMLIFSWLSWFSHDSSNSSLNFIKAGAEYVNVFNGLPLFSDGSDNSPAPTEAGAAGRVEPIRTPTAPLSDFVLQLEDYTPTVSQQLFLLLCQHWRFRRTEQHRTELYSQNTWYRVGIIFMKITVNNSTKGQLLKHVEVPGELAYDCRIGATNIKWELSRD